MGRWRWLLVLTAAAATACTGPADLRRAPLDRGDGLTVSRASADVLPVARRAVREAGFDVTEASRREAGTWILYGERVLTERELTARVRVVVRALGPGETSVWVLVSRTVPTEFRVGGDAYTDRILSWIAAELLEPPGSAAPPRPTGGVAPGIGQVDPEESRRIS